MYLFVYGSLKRNSADHKIIDKAGLYSEAFVNGTLYDLGIEFPAILDEEHPARNKVYGEIYEISDHLLDEIDEFEGYYPDKIDDSFYIRKEMNAKLINGEVIKVQIYVLPQDKLDKFFAIEIKDGKWKG